MIYRARRQMGYGRPIGVLMLAENIPCPPGTPGNPTTFSCPVHYEIVRGVGIDSLRQADGGGSFDAFLDASHRLMERDVRAITGNCGLMIVHQAALARALPVPVLMSSLMQLRWLDQLLGPGATIGVIASTDTSLSAAHLDLARAGAAIDVVVTSMQGKRNFAAAVVEESGTLDAEAVEREAVDVASALVRDHPHVAAILLECADLPPYAAAIQAAVELPVFDITTLVAFVVSGLRRRTFEGVY